MGFDVTATHVIFFVAFLSVGSAAIGGYWKSSDVLEESRRAEAERIEERVHTNITIAGTPSYNGSASRFTFEVRNTGSTVLLISEFVYVIDGKWNDTMESGYPSISGVTGTDYLLPGETMEVRMSPITTQPSFLKVTTGNGVSAYWRA